MLRDSIIHGLCGSIQAGCSMLVNRLGNKHPLSREDQRQIIIRMEIAAARLDNGNREPCSDFWIECCLDDVRECARYYREVADNFRSQVA
jgi:hypothetical protein